jgi:hypothetical protein
MPKFSNKIIKSSQKSESKSSRVNYIFPKIALRRRKGEKAFQNIRLRERRGEGRICYYL